MMYLKIVIVSTSVPFVTFN